MLLFFQEDDLLPVLTNRTWDLNTLYHQDKALYIQFVGHQVANDGGQTTKRKSSNLLLIAE